MSTKRKFSNRLYLASRSHMFSRNGSSWSQRSLSRMRNLKLLIKYSRTNHMVSIGRSDWLQLTRRQSMHIHVFHDVRWLLASDADEVFITGTGKCDIFDVCTGHFQTRRVTQIRPKLTKEFGIAFLTISKCFVIEVA